MRRSITAMERMLLSRRSVILGSGAALLAARSTTAATTATMTPAPIVKTRNGRLRGQTVAGVATYKGIPYGAPTGGANRFLPPRPPASWSGVRDATRYGHPSPQVLRLPGVYPFPAWIDSESQSEDCLNLNVWSPRPDVRAPRPVMVWFHGGGYARGSGNIPIYDGHHLASDGDVVVVTVNHRLNIFGYAHVASGAPAEFAASGNAGQQDLVAALHWVRDNIAGFGGDPSNVTIFGESGGGGKVSALLAMPVAKGLFHKAIVMSGSALEVITPDVANATAERVYAHLGLKPGDIAALQRVPMAQLYDCFEKLSVAAPGAAMAQFGPVLDGQVITRQTWTPDAPGISRDIPMLIGNSTDETAAFIATPLEEPIPDDADLAVKLVRYGGRRIDTEARAQQLIALYRAAMPGLSRTQLLVRITTDLGMWRNALTQAERKQAAGAAPAFVYEFGWTTPAYGGQWALHSLILPFVFGNHDYGPSWDIKDSAAVRAAADPAGDYRRVGAQIIGAWSTFARTGNPSTAALGQWLPYSPERRSTMLFGRETRLTDGLRDSVRSAVMAF